MLTDPIADMLTRIRNAALARHERTEMPLSNMRIRLADILKAEGYIADYKVDRETGFGVITLFLKYHGRDKTSAIVGMRRVSRPGRRLYVGHGEIPKVQNGFGVAILSTSQGVITDKTARERRVGGELLCEVW